MAEDTSRVDMNRMIVRRQLEILDEQDRKIRAEIEAERQKKVLAEGQGKS